MSINPLISVIMCVYNTNKEWLTASIESILNQTYRNFEFIIVLDCPTDGCENVVYNYANKDKRIVVIKNKKNLGLTKSLNVGLLQSRGTYIARMDSDDISLKNRLKIQLNYMQKHPEVAVVGSYISIFGDGKYTSGTNFYSDDYERERIRLLFANAGVAHPTAFIRKKFLEEYKIRYNEEYRKAQDFALWVDICNANGKIALINNVLLLYRASEAQISKKNSGEQNECHKRIVQKQLNRLFTPTENELNIHCELFYFNCLNSIENYQRYIVKIIEANESKKIYDTRLFKQEVYAFWIRAVFTAVIRYKRYSFLGSSLFWKALLDIKVIGVFLVYIQKNRRYNQLVSRMTKSKEIGVNR